MRRGRGKGKERIEKKKKKEGGGYTGGVKWVWVAVSIFIRASICSRRGPRTRLKPIGSFW